MARFVDPAPPRVVVIRTERFALRASIYLDLYASLVRGEDADREEVRDRARRLIACDDDRCAATALTGDAHAAAFEAALPAFGDPWRAYFALERAAMERALPWLADNEDAIARSLTRDLALAWPQDPVVLAVTAHAAPPSARPSVDAPTLDVEGGCFAGAAILECAFSSAARSLAPHLPRQAIARAVGRAVVRAVPGYLPEESRSPSPPASH